MSRWKYMKAALGGLGTGLCLMSLIAAVDDDEWSWKAVGAGVGLTLITFSIVQEIEDRRAYRLLYESDNQRLKMISENKNLKPYLLRTLGENLDKESELLNNDSDF